MSAISYAQNYEDVMLLRALRDVQRGFYVDIGAQDPIHGSVTKAFYENGWRGINVEPVARWFKAVAKDRPEDTNLQVVVSEAIGEVSFFEVPETGLSTLEQDIAHKHAKEGHVVEEYSVVSRPLDSILDEFAAGDIHFLKIDVEGAEGTVLNSISLQKHRPWILVIEATEPNSQTPAYADWEPRVLGSGYLMVYEDGLNRFYLASERKELASAFRLPPNYFDFFIPYSEWCAKKELEARARLLEERVLELSSAKRELDVLVSTLTHVRTEHDELSRRVEQGRNSLAMANVEIKRLSDAEIERSRRDALELAALRMQLSLVEQSHSWKMTAPLRSGRRALGRARPMLRAFAIPFVRLVAKIPGMRAFARHVLASREDLKRRLSALAYEPAASLSSDISTVMPVEADRIVDFVLSESAGTAYTFLKRHRYSKNKVS